MSQQATPKNALSIVEDIAALLVQPHSAQEQGSLITPNDTQWLLSRIEKLKRPAFSIVVAGGFNSGKSTLINALIGEEILHDGAIPTTLIITRIVKGDAYQAKLVYQSGKEEILNWDDFRNRKVASFESKEIQRLDIYVPYEVLALGVEIIDTPGLNEHEQRTKLVLDYLPSTDAIVIAIDATKPLGRDDVEFIRLLGRPPLEHVFFVTCRMGLLKEIARQDVLQYINNRVSPLLKPSETIASGQDTLSKRLFFADAKAVLSGDAKEVSFDFYDFREALIAFLDVENRQAARLKGLAQELAELYYRIKQRHNAMENACSQSLSILEQRFNASEQKTKAIRKASDEVSKQLTAIGVEMGEHIYNDLLGYIDRIEKNWPNDVKDLDLSELEKLNILSIKISQQEKTRLSEILSKELKYYLDIKLLQWMQQIPDAISPVFENLSYKIREDMVILGLEVATLEEGLAVGSGASPHNLKDVGGIEALSLSAHHLIGNSIQGLIKWPFFGDLEKTLKNPDVLKMVGFSTVGAVLALGAAVLGSNPVGIFVATLGYGLFNTLKLRHEQREMYKMMHEESSSATAYKDLGSSAVSDIQRAVRAALEEETGKHFFHEVRKEIANQKSKIIDGVAAELGTVAVRMKANLDRHLASIMAHHEQLLARKTSGEQSVTDALEQISQFSASYRKLFDGYCQSALGYTMSESDIEEIGKARAWYLHNYVRMLESPPVIDTSHLIKEEYTEIPEQAPSRGDLPAEQIRLRIKDSLNRILGITTPHGELPPGSLKTPQAELTEMVGIQQVKDNVKELMDFQATQAKRRKGGRFTGSLHLIFTGNPGTGKTTVARIIGRLYRDLGLLSSGHTVEVKAGDLIAGYVGQTSEKTRKKINEALDGVLFIDEAYALASRNPMETNFGKEVIVELLGAMETYRDRLVVIVAGYHDEIQWFLDADPGLRSRFPLDNHFHFQNYSPDELYQILTQILSVEGWSINDAAKEAIKESLIGYCELKGHEKSFDNARYARNFAESLMRKTGARINRDNLPTDTPVGVEDIEAKYAQFRPKKMTDVPLDKMTTSPLGIDTKPYSSNRERRRIVDQEKCRKRLPYAKPTLAQAIMCMVIKSFTQVKKLFPDN